MKAGALYCGACGSPAAQAPVPMPPPVPPAMIGTIGGGPVPAPPPPGSPLSAPPGFAGYATFGRRVGAYLIDAIPSLIISGLAYALFFSAVVGRSAAAANASLILLLVGPLAYFVVLWAMAAKGSSPGNAILGIRVVRESGGGEPGAGLGLGRLLLKGLLISITFYIGGFSPLWDSSGRRKGWWDSACNTVVLDRDAVPAYRAAAGGPGAAGAQPVGYPTPNGYPTPDSFPSPEAYRAPEAYPPPLDSYAASTSWPPEANPAQQWPQETGFDHALNPPGGPGAPAVAGWPSIADDRPAWDIPPVHAADPVGVRPAAPVPAATWGDRPADPAVPSFGAAAGPPPPPPPTPPPPTPPLPAAAGVVAAPPAPAPDLAPANGLPWALPAEPAVISSVPGFGASWATPAAEESPDHTRLRVAPQETGSGWVAEVDDGRSLPLVGKLILGRDPSALSEDGDATTVSIADVSRSVSKTHLMLEVGPGGAQVTDRHSTNGVVVVTAGVELTCVPGVATPVPDGSTVRFGDRSLRVRRG